MSAAGFSSSPSIGAPEVSRSMTGAMIFGVAAAQFAGAGLIFCGVAAYLSLTPYVDPPLAALAVGGGSLALALIAAWIGRAIVKASADRIASWAQSSALIALTPRLLGFAARHARLVGLVSAAGAAVFAARSKRAAR